MVVEVARQAVLNDLLQDGHEARHEVFEGRWRGHGQVVQPAEGGSHDRWMLVAQRAPRPVCQVRHRVRGELWAETMQRRGRGRMNAGGEWGRCAGIIRGRGPGRGARRRAAIDLVEAVQRHDGLLPDQFCVMLEEAEDVGGDGGYHVLCHQLAQGGEGGPALELVGGGHVALELVDEHETKVVVRGEHQTRCQVPGRGPSAAARVAGRRFVSDGLEPFTALSEREA